MRSVAFFLYIPMEVLQGIKVFAEEEGKGFSYGHRAVMTAGAADTDS